MKLCSRKETALNTRGKSMGNRAVLRALGAAALLGVEVVMARLTPNDFAVSRYFKALTE